MARTTFISFDTKSISWRKVASMNKSRASAACTVFEGRVVVSGGRSFRKSLELKTVEAYDP